MKKNISINISGIIFHIEEDGYESLRKYLDSISKYFSSFDDSAEILADIESRIAEIFLSKLNEGKQVITAEDVNALITTMGSVSDFKAVEEQDFTNTETKHNPSSGNEQQNSGSNKSYSPPKQLMRDQKRKIMGGVCAGLGSYLNVDPVWIRLLFAILTFAYGITLIVYVVMWIVVPGSHELEEPEVTKKMFRDPERKVIAGVSGGLASFIGIDIIAVRVLFIVLTIAGGLGFLVYIVLWAILPEAKTLTDKMQMQGEPLTLSNIESTLKKNQSVTGNETETPLTKVLLFPFRLIGLIITTLAKILMPLVEVLRVAIGIVVFFVGLILLFSLVMAGGVLLGNFSGWTLPFGGPEITDMAFPIEVFTNTFPTLTTAAGFIALLIPCILILLLGISIVSKRIVFGQPVGWTLFVLFFASVAVLGLTIPGIVYSFQKNGEYTVEQNYVPTGRRLVLKINDLDANNYKGVNLTLKGHDGKEVKLVKTFESQGKTKQEAIENAQMVDYQVDFKDSILTFDSNIRWKKEARFRAQELYMTLYLPYDFPFVMDEDVSRFVSHYIDHENLDGYTWKVTAKGLECSNCPKPTRNENDTYGNGDLSDFSALDINGMVDVTIHRGDEYRVELQGGESEKERYDIYKRGNTLVIDFNGNDKFFWKKQLDWEELHIDITMPDLEKLEAKGAGKITFGEFSSHDLEIDIMGAMKVEGEIHVNSLDIKITGASELELQGDSKNMEAEITGASSLNAYTLEVVDAVVEANGASHAKVNVTGTLEMREGIASDIDYRGNPNVVKD
jgi:phage shock protein PspC (stress-responsive transcriptional regulator)